MKYLTLPLLAILAGCGSPTIPDPVDVAPTVDHATVSKSEAGCLIDLRLVKGKGTQVRADYLTKACGSAYPLIYATDPSVFLQPVPWDPQRRKVVAPPGTWEIRAESPTAGGLVILFVVIH